MESYDKKTKKIISVFIAIFIILLAIIIIALLILKYEVEGENNMPFNLSQIVVVSTAEGISTEGEKIWNFDLIQNNDVYINIAKNKNYKETEIIKKVTINNFKINNEPQKGEIVIYKPTNDENKTYKFSDEYIVQDELVYEGSEKAGIKDLQIPNQGGAIGIRYTNKNLREIFIR